MITNEVSKRYAKALLEVTKQKGTHAKIFSELQAVVDGFSMDPAVKDYFENPLIGSDLKTQSLKAALAGKGLSEEVFNTLVLLAEKNRLRALPDLATAFQELVDIEDGVTRGTIRSAIPLTEDAKKEIQTKISQVLNKKIVLTYKQDSKLIAGVVADVGGWTFDDSVETHLKKLNEELNRRSN